VLAIGTAQGTASAGNPDEVVPDMALQNSADLAVTADPSGPTAESSAHTIYALATVAKKSAPGKTSEDPSTEGMFTQKGTIHSTADSGAPVPTLSQGRSVNDALVFGPSDWDD
jgi:hypothetical protein